LHILVLAIAQEYNCSKFTHWKITEVSDGKPKLKIRSSHKPGKPTKPRLFVQRFQNLGVALCLEVSSNGKKVNITL
jgi:hypothetical protein